MPVPLVRTKLHRPPVPSGDLHRERLLAALGDGSAPLTLVSAPAGYGKSVLVSQWVGGLASPCAWLSLEPEDSDLGVFVRYFLAAVRSVFPGACPETSNLIESAHRAPLSILGASLVNELDGLGTRWVMVLDDYHRIQPGSDVHELLRFLLQHPVPGLGLVVATRNDPPLGIASLRGRGGLAEFRLRDLKFTTEEIAEYFEHSSRVRVSRAAMANLERETEGWAVGLRLVCFALGSASDPEQFLAEMHGGTQSAREYLVAEVLKQLSPEFLQCLLRSSVLDRFCASLCHALFDTGQEPGAAAFSGERFLRSLESSNLFAIHLDSQGEWMRYHHLFQEFLQGELERRTSAEEVAAIHLRASAWFEEHDLIDEALQHALRGGAPERAARLVEDARVPLLDSDQWRVLERWLKLLPAAAREGSPGLLLGEAWGAFERLQFEYLVGVLDKVEGLLERNPEPALLCEVVQLRGNLLYWSGQAQASCDMYERALALQSPWRGIVRGLIEMQYGFSLCAIGERDRAIEFLQERMRQAGPDNTTYYARLLAGLVFVHMFSGNLSGAREEGQRLSVIANRSGIVHTGVWTSFMQGFAHLHAGDPGAARPHFEAALRQRYILHPRWAVDALVGLALAQQLAGERDAASETVEELHAFALDRCDAKYLSLARSFRARIALLQGDLAAAVEWARSVREAPAHSGLFFWIEVPATTRARVLLAEGSPESLREAAELLREVRSQSESCHYEIQLFEVGVLEVLLLEAEGHHDEALRALGEVLELTAPSGFARPFLEAGAPVTGLLRQLPESERRTRFVAQLLGRVVRADAAAIASRGVRANAEPLTNREQEILELLAQRLQDKEIASRIFISPQTVNSHLKNVYQKLGVRGRRQAVARAAELGLLPID